MKIEVLNNKDTADIFQVNFNTMEILLVMAALRELSKSLNFTEEDRSDARKILLHIRKEINNNFGQI